MHRIHTSIHSGRRRTASLLTVCVLEVHPFVWGASIQGDASIWVASWGGCIHLSSSGGCIQEGETIWIASRGFIHRGGVHPSWWCIYPRGASIQGEHLDCILGGASILVASWMHPPPVNRMTHACETLLCPILTMRAVIKMLSNFKKNLICIIIFAIFFQRILRSRKR